MPSPKYVPLQGVWDMSEERWTRIYAHHHHIRHHRRLGCMINLTGRCNAAAASAATITLIYLCAQSSISSTCTLCIAQSTMCFLHFLTHCTAHISQVLHWNFAITLLEIYKVLHTLYTFMCKCCKQNTKHSSCSCWRVANPFSTSLIAIG